MATKWVIGNFRTIIAQVWLRVAVSLDFIEKYKISRKGTFVLLKIHDYPRPRKQIELIATRTVLSIKATSETNLESVSPRDLIN